MDLSTSVFRFLNNNLKDILRELTERGIIKLKKRNIENIPEENDSIGDTFELKNRLDYNNRDFAFVDIDGNILVSDKGKTHAQLLQNYLDEASDYKLKDGWKRPDIEEIDEALQPKYCAFGHILDDCIFIETYTGVSCETILSDIKKSDISYDKIYKYNDFEVTRVAKRYKNGNK